MKSGVVFTARTYLQMTQKQFGIWLGEQLGRPAYSEHRISEWESPNIKLRTPRHVWDVCADVAIEACAKQIQNSIATVGLGNTPIHTIVKQCMCD